jgi:hypothetical protein
VNVHRAADGHHHVGRTNASILNDPRIAFSTTVKQPETAISGGNLRLSRGGYRAFSAE